MAVKAGLSFLTPAPCLGLRHNSSTALHVFLMVQFPEDQPCSIGETLTKIAATVATMAARQRHSKILLAEDNLVNQKVAIRFQEKQGQPCAGGPMTQPVCVHALSSDEVRPFKCAAPITCVLPVTRE